MRNGLHRARTGVIGGVVFMTAASLAGQQASQPRTPWGDPDLQGTYTNTYENGTPLERPDQFAGRKLEDVKGEELRAMKRAIQQRTIAQFLGPEHAPDSLPLTADPNPVPLYECHEGNYGLRNILSAARAVEAGAR